MVVRLLVLLLLSCGTQAGAQMTLAPGALTVLRGDEARFTCSTSDARWTVMVWLLNGTAVLTVSKSHGVLPSTGTNVTAEPASGSKGDGWTFVLRSAERRSQGQVTCDLQGIDRKTANLFVQEKGVVRVSGDDQLALKGQPVQFECQAAGWFPEPRLQWQVNDREVSEGDYNVSSEESGKSLFTVSSNLSVTAAKSSRVDCLASVSGLRTPLKSSVRLTVGSSTPEATWFDQSVVGISSVAEATRGKVNLGYSSEGHTDADYNELIMEIRRKMDFDSFHKVPDVVHSSGPAPQSESRVQASPSEGNPTSVRRITTV
ncbi:immunoglobulin superfamily member 5 isoform X2 [Scophthalmus maximus]|uniref:immunoglobulin superfamily member 5 isoform X2 n=1 Tax=Scophthalmus maximus TaxID=52904 RepID=UPI001FA8940F|nr:immunoglobulin superfamily member 5 isoform X2 [Scophthalmus maximus]